MRHDLWILLNSAATDAIQKPIRAGLEAVASLYIQTGEAGTDGELQKEHFMASLAARMAALAAAGVDAVLCGDWNITGGTETTSTVFTSTGLLAHQALV